MSREFMRMVDKVRRHVEGARVLPVSVRDLAVEVGDHERSAAFDGALHFLIGREELLAGGSTVEVTPHNRVASQILADVQRLGPISIDALARTTSISLPLCCEVLGWLEREGKITFDTRDRVSIPGQSARWRQRLRGNLRSRSASRGAGADGLSLESDKEK